MKTLFKWASLLTLMSFVGLVVFVSTRFDDEIYKFEYEELPKDKRVSKSYPWFISKDTISKVSDYKDAYDIDSNDWIADFRLLPRETKRLGSVLEPIPKANQNYRCVLVSDWAIKYDICSFEAMIGAGFRGYFYNPSFCEAGCKQVVILWVDPQTGQSFIVGSPDA